MHYSGLGIARNLHGTGAEIYCVSAKKESYGNYSRYCKHVEILDTEKQGDRCALYLERFALASERKPVLLPTRDQDLEFLCKYEDRLGSYLVPYESIGHLKDLLNKDAVLGVARNAGLPCPKSVLVAEKGDIEREKKNFTFPCIAKPVFASEWRREDVWETVGRKKGVRIDRYSDLVTFYDTISDFGIALNVQEYIHGNDEDLVIFGSFYNPRKNKLAYFTGRKLIQYPGGIGTGVVVRCEANEEVVRMSKVLLDSLGYYGVSEIEYKYDRRAGEYKFIELNPRHWDQHELGKVWGVNLSRILYEDLTGQFTEDKQMVDSRVGTWIAEDGYISSFLGNLRDGYYPNSLYLQALKGRKVCAVCSLSDIKPTLAVSFAILKIIFLPLLNRARALFQRARRGAKAGDKKRDPA